MTESLRVIYLNGQITVNSNFPHPVGILNINSLLINKLCAHNIIAELSHWRRVTMGNGGQGERRRSKVFLAKSFDSF